MENNLKISIIIPHFFGVDYLIDCLNSVFKSDYPDFEVIVVFNGNKDKSYEVIKEKFSRVITILNKKNLGFAKSNNQAIKISNGEIIFLLNDDTVIHPQLLFVLLQKLISSDKIGIVGPKIYFANEPHKIWFAGGKIDWAKQKSYHLGRDVEDAAYQDSEKEVDFITGCALMIKKEVINKIGLLDERFFAFYEDSDWCLRAKKAGYKIIYVPFGGVWHIKSATAGKIFFGEEKGKNILWLILNYFYRDSMVALRRYKNKIIFFNRYLFGKNKFIFLLKSIFISTPVLAWEIVYKIPKSIFRLRRRK
jgi:GT2 family glycosyltransferase